MSIKSAFLAVLLLLPASTFCQVPGVIGVKFGFSAAASYAITNDLYASDAAGILIDGVLAVSNWNNLLITDASSLSATENVTWNINNDSAGNALSGVSLTPAGFNDGWYSGGTECANGRLLTSFWKLNLGDAHAGVGKDAGGNTYALFTFANLPESTYDVYVFVNDNNGNYWANIEAAGGNAVFAVGTNIDDSGFNGADSGNSDPCGLTPQLHTATGYGNNANYVEMPAVTTSGGSIVITVDSHGGGDIGISGIELVPTGTGSSGPPIPGAPIVTPSSASIAMLAGPDVTLTTAALGLAPITWQWQTDGGSGNTPTNIPGATDSNLVVNTTGLANGVYKYDFVANNTSGIATSSTAEITITSLFMEDIGTNAPTPGAADIAQLLFTPYVTGSYAPAGLNYYTDGGAGHGAWSGQTFTTSSSPNGYVLNSLAWLSGGNGADFSDFQLWDLNIYALSDSGSNAVSVANYAVYGGGAQKDWLEFVGLGVALAPNTQYAYTLGRDPSSAGYEIIETTGGNPYAGGQICTIPATTGGPVSYGNTNTFDATFDIGLSIPSKPFAPLPTFTSVPDLTPFYPGTVLTLSEFAVGAPTLSYQWLSDNGTGGATWTPVLGGTGTNLVVNTTTLAPNNYEYEVVVSNTFGGSTSPPLTINLAVPVAPYPVTDITPLNPARAFGGTVTFSAVFNGGLPITYQWQVNTGAGATNIPGATSNVLVLNNLSFASAGTYQLLANNNAGNSNTSFSVLSIVEPGISVQFEGGANGYQNLTAGQTAGFVPLDNWNVDGQNSGDTATNLVDYAGNPTVATVNVTFNAGHYGTADNTGTPDGVLMSGGFWSGGGYTIDVKGVPYAAYDVYIYMLNDNNPFRRYGFGLGSQTNWGSVFDGNNYIVPPYTLDTQTTELPKGTQMQANLVRFTGVTGSSFTINGQTPDGNVAMMGMQIYSAYEGPAVAGPIELSPSVSTIYAGLPLTLTEVPISGAPPLSYQWVTDGGTGGSLLPIPGGTNSILPVNTSTFASGNYAYAVVVTNTAGSSTSEVLNVTITASAPVVVTDITPEPVNEGYVGQTLTYSAVFGGTLPITYQWMVDTGSGPTNIPSSSNPSAITATLVLSDLQLANAGTYSVFATNPVGGQLSSSSTLTVLPDPAPPAAGTYGAAILADGPLAYWQFNESEDPSTGVLPAYDSSGHNFDGLYSAYSENGFNGIQGPQSPSFPGFPANNTALQTENGAAVATFVPVPSLNINTNAVTISMWIEPTGVQAVFNSLFKYQNIPDTDAAGFGFGPTVNSNNMAALGYTWNSNSAATYNWDSGLFPLVNQWSFVALVISPTNATIYLYYIDPNTGNPDLYSAVNPITNGLETFSGGTNLIGSDPDSVLSRTFQGNIDEVAFFTQSFTSDQILAMFTKATGLVGGIAPQISGQPQSVVTLPERTVIFAATGINGTTPFSYQWQYVTATATNNVTDSGNITGAETTTLTISAVTTNNAGSYQLIVTNSVGSTTSSLAALTLITQVPSSYKAGVLADSPLAFWPLNETTDNPALGGVVAYELVSSFNGTYGTNARDGFNGIQGPQPPEFTGFAAGNTALETFTGTPGDSFVSASAGDLIATNLTYAMWINPSGPAGNWTGLLMDRGGAGEGLGFGGNVDATGMSALGYTWNQNNGDTYGFNSHLFPATNQWSFVAMVIQPTQAALYMIGPDGVVHSAVNPIAHDSETFGIAWHIGNDAQDGNVGDRNFPGRISSVSVFLSALTVDQLVTLYGGGAGTGAPPVTIDIAKSSTPGSLTLSWASGTLLQSTNLLGPWTTNTSAASPYTVAPSNSQTYFKVLVN